MMAEATKKSSRAALLAALCAAALSAGLLAALTDGPPVRAAAQNQAQPQPPKPKKKLPPGAKGFEQYATRDASDKLATGGGTRSGDVLKDKALVDAQAAIAEGREAYEKGQYAKAIELFSRAIMHKRDMLDAHYSLGVAYEAAGRFKEAAAAYKVALALKPDPANPNSVIVAHYNLANTLAASGQHADAAESYRQLIAKLEASKTPMAQPHYNLGLSLVALERYDDAAAAFGKAVELNPGYAEAHYNLGLIHSRAERYAEAIESFGRALAARAEAAKNDQDMKADYPEALYNLGLAYYLTDNGAGLAEQQKKLQTMNSPLAAELAKLTGGK